MTNSPTPDTATPKRVNQRRAAAFRRFTIGTLVYAVIVIAAGFVVGPDVQSVWLRLGLAVAPMVAAVWAMANWLEAVRSFDEFQQKVFTESGLIALGITAAATFTYGFLEAYVGLPKVSMFTVFPFMAFCYTLSLPIVRRRYQ